MPAGRSFGVSTSLKITKAIQIVGSFSELKVIQPGLDKILDISNAAGYSIRGVKFNDNLRGRTAISLSNCTDFTVEDCTFTGYSADYGYYKTDSAIRLSTSNHGTIRGNRFTSFGNQYLPTQYLVRSITFDTNDVSYVHISDNNFSSVSQGIIINGGQHNIISNNTFDDVQDNCFYILSNTNDLLVSGNVIRNGHDEGIVLSGSNITLNNNSIIDSPNKAIAINGDTTNLLVQGNTFQNTSVASGSFIAFRANTYKLQKCLVQNNSFFQAQSTTASEYFSFRGDVQDLNFSGNDIQVQTAAFQRMLYFNGNVATAMISNNNFQGSNSSAKAIEVDPATVAVDVLFKGNRLSNCRGVLGKLKVQDQLVSGQYIVGGQQSSVIWSTAVPTVGTWNKGDIVWNSSPSAASAPGWVCVMSGTPGTWDPLPALP